VPSWLVIDGEFGASFVGEMFLNEIACMASTAAIRASGVSILGDGGGSRRSRGLGLDCHRLRLAWNDASPSLVAGGLSRTLDVIVLNVASRERG
jgi:hypothetical protein